MVKLFKLESKYVNYGKNMVAFNKTDAEAFLTLCLLVPRHPVF